MLGSVKIGVGLITFFSCRFLFFFSFLLGGWAFLVCFIFFGIEQKSAETSLAEVLFRDDSLRNSPSCYRIF